MNADQFRRLEALYDAAAALDPAERARFIDAQCGDDDEIRRELEAALSGDARSGLTAVVDQASTAFVQSDSAWTGRRVGPYRIVRPLGQGGMGTVYLAVRDDAEFHKDVAVKTLKFDLGGDAAIARFRQERQILAHLEHPNIARLLDGGTTDAGTPYIVLEYIEGVQIAQWCTDRRLSIAERLRLFRPICDAVQYAHQRLIVHRDIKPGNILVTSDGAPKLLDFGIAKLIDADTPAGVGSPRGATTGAALMTPDYVSPEQVRGEPVSTASDVYSLGAVLYELLADTRPHDLHTYDPIEIARVVCDTDVRPPSAHGDRRLRGDLDNIVLKAMHKDPSRRYVSATALADDIGRYLDGLPVAARPDTVTYRTLKFVRRHRVGVAASLAIVLSLAIGVGLALREARVAQRRFAQVRELATTFLFQFYDQVMPLAGSTAVRASIVETARTYLDGLAADAGRDRSLLLELAEAYLRLGNVQGSSATASLGQLDAARRSYQSALAMYERLPPAERAASDVRRGMAGVLWAFARLEYNAEHQESAEALARRMLDTLGASDNDTAARILRARGLRTLSDIRLRRGDATDAIDLTSAAARILADVQASGYTGSDLPNEIALTRQRLARARAAAGDLDGALGAFESLVASSPPCDEANVSTPACRTLAAWLDWTGDMYAATDRPNLGLPEKAVPLYERAIRISERIAALDAKDRQAHFDLAARYGKLGDAVWASNPARALDLYERALATGRQLAAQEQIQSLRDSYIVAVSRPLIKLGRLADARRGLVEALARAKAEAGLSYADRVGELTVRGIWPRLLIAEGRRQEAIRALDDLIHDLDALRADHRDDLTLVAFVSDAYRTRAAITTGADRRRALLGSAAAWHAWPATTFTQREEQKDLRAAELPR